MTIYEKVVNKLKDIKTRETISGKLKLIDKID